MTNINQLSSATSLVAGDTIPIWSVDNGDSRKASITTFMTYVRANMGAASGTSMILSSYVKTTGMAVASLPGAALVGAGARATVTDANATLTAGIGAVVAAGGANVVPVFSDGTNWRIG